MTNQFLSDILEEVKTVSQRIMPGCKLRLICDESGFVIYIRGATDKPWVCTACFAFAIDHERVTASQMVMTDDGLSPMVVHSARFMDGGAMGDLFRLFRERLATACAVPVSAK